MNERLKQKPKPDASDSVIEEIEKRIDNLENQKRGIEMDKTFPTMQHGNLDIPCTKCGKTSRQLIQEGHKNVNMINLNLDNPEIDQFWCPSCLQKKKMELLDAPTNKGPGKTRPAEQPRVRPQVVIKNQQSPPIEDETSTPPQGNLPNVDINKIFQLMNSELVNEKENEFDRLTDVLHDEDVGTIKRMVFEWPDRCSFIFAALRYINYQIDEFNPVLERISIDYKSDKSVYRNKKISKAVSILPSRFYVKNSAMLSRIINAAMYHLEELYADLEKKFGYIEEIEYSFKSIRGALMELNARNNPFEGQMTMIKHNSKELRKLFSAIEINLVRLSMHERKILNDTDEMKKILGSWGKISSRDQKRFIANNLDVSLIPEMEDLSKQKFFDKLLKDDAIQLRPQELASLFTKMDNYEDRLAFLKSIKPELRKKELDVIVSGTIFDSNEAANP